MRILFMGTPDFAVPSLESLVAAGHTVCGVFTQPDKPRNRGMKLQAPPVKVCALAHNIPVYQPVKLRDGAALALIQELAPELIVVAAYGRILPDEILAAPPKGCINVHSSLLPNYRGAAPIHWAVLNGDRETGVTIMHMAHDLDAGDIIAQAATPIDPDETVVALHDRLAVLGAELLVNVVADIAAGTAVLTLRQEVCLTVNASIDFLDAAGLGSTLIAVGHVDRMGKSLCFCHTDITDETGRLLATLRTVMDLTGRPLEL